MVVKFVTQVGSPLENDIEKAVEIFLISMSGLISFVIGLVLGIEHKALAGTLLSLILVFIAPLVILYLDHVVYKPWLIKRLAMTSGEANKGESPGSIASNDAKKVAKNKFIKRL